MSTTKYGITASSFSGKIFVGALTKDGTAFRNKEDQTGPVLGAVADWAIENFSGSTVVTVGDKVMEIDVREDTDEARDERIDRIKSAIRDGLGSRNPDTETPDDAVFRALVAAGIIAG